MEQIDQQPPEDAEGITPISFSARVASLRQSLAEADPLGAGASAASKSVTSPTEENIQTQADALAQAFQSAESSERVAILMRALDDAIAALDVACLLADEFTGDTGAIQALIAVRQQATLTGQRGYRHTQKKKYARYEDAAPTPDQSAPDETITALFDAYTAFREAQPGFQGLYHFRNALAHFLRQPEREIPSAPQDTQEETSGDSETSEGDH